MTQNSASPSNRLPTDIAVANIEDSEQRAKVRRAKQTWNNLSLSLLACFGIVLGLVLIVPRDESSRLQPVDYVSIAKQAESSSSLPIVAPELISNDWYSNSARWAAKPADGVAVWYAGFVGPKSHYIGLTQAFNSNPTWLVLFLKESIITGETKIGGRPYSIYESTVKNNPPKSKDFALVTNVNNDQIIIYGTATRAELETFAIKLNQQIDQKY